MRYILTIDLGTSSTRTLAFDEQGQMVVMSQLELEVSHPQEGWVEQDAQEIWDKTWRTFKAVADYVGAGNIFSLSITTQRETVILWDRLTGEPVAPAISWQDQRGQKVLDKMKLAQDHHQSEQLKHKTGLRVHPYFSASKLKWALENVDTVKKCLAEGNLAFGTPESWLIWNLTAGQTHATEPSNASRTLLFNIRTNDWDSELLDLFNIPDSILPQVLPSDAEFGLTDLTVLETKVPIRGVLGDQQAALFAHTQFKSGLVKNTYGTGLFLMTSTEQEIVKSENLLTTVAGRINNQTYYALEGSVLSGGEVIRWLRDQKKLITDPAQTETIAQKLDSNHGVYFVPAFHGLAAPYWDPQAKVVLDSPTGEVSGEELVRAALESLAFQTYDVVQAMNQTLDEPLTELVADGGASRNHFLMQFQADLLNIPVQVSAITESTAWGVTLMSGLAYKFYLSAEAYQFKKSQVAQTFTAQINPKSREEMLLKWRQAIDKSLQSSAKE